MGSQWWVESELAERNKKQLHSNSEVISRCQLQLQSEHDYVLSQLYSISAVVPRKRDPTLLQLQTEQLSNPESTPTPDRSCPSLSPEANQKVFSLVTNSIEVLTNEECSSQKLPIKNRLMLSLTLYSWLVSSQTNTRSKLPWNISYLLRNICQERCSVVRMISDQ